MRATVGVQGVLIPRQDGELGSEPLVTYVEFGGLGHEPGVLTQRVRQRIGQLDAPLDVLGHNLDR